MRKKIVAGNWKMNTLPAEGVELAKGIVAGRGEVCSCVNFIVCPPFTHLSQVAEALKGSDIALGAQDCATEAKGAYTGEIAASMIAALGCKYVILGHSERRQYYGETSATLNKKMAQAYANGLTPIYCVGENLEEREAGKHFDVVKAQIEEVVYNLTEEEYKNLVIAYEPVWARLPRPSRPRKSTLTSARCWQPNSARQHRIPPSSTAVRASPRTHRSSSPRKTSTAA